MNADLAPAVKDIGYWRRAFLTYREISGQPLAVWALVALFNFIAQVALRRELNPGEFGTLNCALAAIGLMTVPMAAINLAFTSYLALPRGADQTAPSDCLRAAALPFTETFAWIWGAISLVLIFLLLHLLDLPRFSLQIFSLINFLVATGGLLSWAICKTANQLRLWSGLVIGSAAVLALASAGIASREPWAEAGLAAFLLAGFVTLAPALRVRETELSTRVKAFYAVLDRDFLVDLGACFSVLLALFLFTNGDRLVAQKWFGDATNNNLGLVDYYELDAYQTAGLIARSLLWGTQPLLWIFFIHRSGMVRTTKTSLSFFWIYLATLVLGVVFLFPAAGLVSQLFCGNSAAPSHSLATTSQLTAHFVPSLAAVMIPLGLLQGLGIFSLASRRYPECFVIGGCSVAYTLVLFLFGRQPELMVSYMFGTSVVALMILLFVGVVRWGRKQP